MRRLEGRWAAWVLTMGLLAAPAAEPWGSDRDGQQSLRVAPAPGGAVAVFGGSF